MASAESNSLGGDENSQQTIPSQIDMTLETQMPQCGPSFEESASQSFPTAPAETCDSPVSATQDPMQTTYASPTAPAETCDSQSYSAQDHMTASQASSTASEASTDSQGSPAGDHMRATQSFPTASSETHYPQSSTTEDLTPVSQSSSTDSTKNYDPEASPASNSTEIIGANVHVDTNSHEKYDKQRGQKRGRDGEDADDFPQPKKQKPTRSKNRQKIRLWDRHSERESSI